MLEGIPAAMRWDGSEGGLEPSGLTATTVKV